MNETLEAMARAIFKSWFVDFDPVRAKAEGRQPPGMDAETARLFPDMLIESDVGRLPAKWEVAPMASIVEVISGGTPRTSVAKYWDGDIPWFSVVDAPRPSDVYVIGTQRRITQAGLEASAATLLPKGTTIISARGTVGKLALVSTPMAMNQSCYGLCGKGAVGQYFVYFTTNHLVSTFKQRTHGTVFDTITRDTFQGVLVVVPPQAVLAKFEQTVAPLMSAILANLYESQTLSSIRDTLLPKLLSGEIRTQQVETSL